MPSAVMPFYGDNIITQTYKLYKHNGIDIYCPNSDEVRAICSGLVLLARKDNVHGGGNIVMIEDNAGNVWLYAHLKEILVKENTRVFVGDIIGIQGNTGNSKGKHLHLAYMLNGDPNQFVNPCDILGVELKVGDKIPFTPETYIQCRVVKQTKNSIQVEYENMRGTLK